MRLTGAMLKREIVVPGRKLRTFLVRGGYSLILAATFGIVFLVYAFSAVNSGGTGASIRMVRVASEYLFNALVTINILACLLFTPAYVASAISQEKDQRTMQDLLLTPMGAIEIVVSKLAGRLSQVLLVLAAGLPLVAICSLLGGVSGMMVLALTAMILLWLVTAGSFTLLISVLVRRTRDAVLGSYVLGVWVLIGATIVHFVPTPVLWLNNIIDAFYPFTLVSAASSGIPELSVWQIIGQTAVILGTFSGLCAMLSVLLLRPLCIRHIEVKGSKRGRRLRRRVRELPDERPILWKEQCFPPSGRITQFLRLLGLLAVAGMCVLLGFWLWSWYTTSLANELFSGATYFFFMAWPVYLSLLLTSSSAIAGERERATWDAVLTSPLEGREIVLGKLAGSLWDVRWWLVALALYFVLVFLQGTYQPAFWSESEPSATPIVIRTLRSFGLMVTGVFVRSPGLVGLVGEILFVLGVGLRTSIRSSSSGRALAIALMIWIGASVVFWIVVYISIFAIALVFLALGNRYAPMWTGPYGQVILQQFKWVGPLLVGLFWGTIGVWLIWRTLQDFDEFASRMSTREVLRAKGLPAKLNCTLAAPRVA